MRKKELIKASAKKSGETSDRTKAVIESFLEVVMEELRSGGNVTLNGFGKFYLKPYSGRTVKVPNGEYYEIAKREIPVFKAGAAFKEYVRGL